MLSYPNMQQFMEASTILVNAARSGFAPDGEHGDLACCVQAGWGVQGFGLSVWKPHDHPDIKGDIKGVMSGDEAGQLKTLAAALEPVTVKGATADVAALPWAQIIALAMTLLQQWLSRK